MKLDPLLLQMLGNSNGGSPNKAIRTILQNQDSLSPKAQMLLQLMDANESTELEGDDDEPENNHRENSQAISRELHILQNELDEALEMVDVFADAIGACSACFGGEDGCPVCNGLGIAGWQRPDPQLFSHFVAPAIRRVNKQSHNEPETKGGNDG